MARITTARIHKKTLFIITISVIMLVGVICALSWVTVMGGFKDLEKKIIHRNISRSQEVIADRLNNLKIKLSDWAIWDDTYAFIENKNEAYIKSNLVDNALATLQIKMIIYFNAQDELVYVMTYDPDRGINNVLPDGLKRQLAKGNYFLTHTDENTFVAGIVMPPEGPMLMVSHSIVQSDGKGPSRGTMLFATYLDADELKRLGNVIKSELEAQKFDAIHLPPDFSAARDVLSKGKETFIRSPDAATIAGYSILKDVSGKDALILKVAVPREITKFGERTLIYFISALIAVGLIFGAVVYMPLELEITGKDRAEKRFVQIAEASEEFIWEVDKKGLYTYANPLVEKILGYKPEELIGKKHFYDFFLADDKEKMRRETLEAMAKKLKFKEYVNTNMHREGWAVILSTTGMPIYDARGNFAGYRGVDVDITQRKLIEEELVKARKKAETATKAKSEFLANMSHEIRTPMTAIIGFLDILGSTPLDEQQKDYVNTISLSGRLLLDIINDILDLSKVEAGEMRFESIDFNLECLVEDVFKLIRVRLGRKPVELIFNIDKEVPAALEGDPSRIRQILINILGNAMKFTDRGSVSLSVGLEDDLGDSMKLIRFTVSDTGIGIPRDKLDRVFDPFSQVDASTSRTYGGTGLGLSICRSYVEKMGGRIWAESESGKGSRFIFTLRLKEKEPGVAGRGIYPITKKTLKGKSIFVVDDNDKTREFIRYICEDAGMTVLDESGPERVIDRMHELARKRGLPEIALMDIMMSIKDGLTLAREIRSDALLKGIKLIAFSAIAVKGIAAEAQKAGFDAYLPKPVFKGELISVLRTVLGGGREEGQIVTRHMANELACKGLKILVAEDNPVNQKLMELLLKSYGCEIFVVNDGKEAIDELRKNTYDVVLMDMQMPVVDGLTATQVIRAEISKELPVLGLSAAIMKDDKDRGFAAGVNDYLIKPIDPIALKESLLKWSGRA